MNERESRFGTCHPVVCFVFFLLAILGSVIFQHPAYLLISLLGSLCLLLTLRGLSGLKTVIFLLPLPFLVALMNPLFNTYGEHILFYAFHRPYTLEALYYGIAIAAMLMAALLWFFSYHIIMTSDKFTSLFGNIIPSLSLLLVMILRLVPAYQKKAAQLEGARRCIGKGGGKGDPLRQRLDSAMCILSSLTSWALEGAVETGDSMRSRGYGTAKRSCFTPYQLRISDRLILVVFFLLGILVFWGACLGWTSSSFTPVLEISPITGLSSFGLLSYGILLFIPSWMNLREVIQWIYFQSKI